VARIIVVEDNPQERHLLRLLLEREGHQVVEAGDGGEAIRAFRQQPSELLLCDLFMPGKEGLETIRELRRDFPDVKIVAMSGGAFNRALNFLPIAARLGALAVLSKPFTVEALLAVVEDVLGKSDTAQREGEAPAEPGGADSAGASPSLTGQSGAPVNFPRAS
jgi:CheY-like chemotaxis protein